jgi:hypothetical protein
MKLDLCVSKYGSTSAYLPEGVFTRDMDLLEDKWREICRVIKHTSGATLTREPAFWYEKSYEKACFPFWIENGKMVKNVKYFLALKRMASIAWQEFKIRLVISITCGAHHKSYEKYSPWNGVKYWKPENYKYVKTFISWLIQYGIQRFEIENESPKGHGQFCWDMYRFLVDDKKISRSKIILGPNRKGPAWIEFHNIQKKSGSENGKIKYNSYDVFHNFDDDKIQIIQDANDLGDPYLRCIMFSYDGIKPRPSILQVADQVEKLLRISHSKRVIIEVLNNHWHDGYDEIGTGLAIAHKRVFGEYPEGYNKYPKLEEPEKPEPVEPDPIDPPEPEEPKEENEMKFDWKIFFQNIWKWLLKPMKIQKIWILLWILLGFILGRL